MLKVTIEFLHENSNRLCELRCRLEEIQQRLSEAEHQFQTVSSGFEQYSYAITRLKRKLEEEAQAVEKLIQVITDATTAYRRCELRAKRGQQSIILPVREGIWNPTVVFPYKPAIIQTIDSRYINPYVNNRTPFDFSICWKKLIQPLLAPEEGSEKE